MITAPPPENEAERLRELIRHDILDTPAEREFDDLVQLASQICGTPISLVSLIDAERQWFKAKVGLAASETPRELAFCAHAILDGDTVLEVPDATQDARFAENPLVKGDSSIRFYAGVPLKMPSGHSFGTLCVIDQVPRELTDAQRFALQTLAQQVISQLELRLRNRQLTKINENQQRLLSVISHDLRSPLASITQMLKMFGEMNVTPEEIALLSAEAQQATDSATRLLENLLAWASHQRADITPTAEAVDLNALAETQFSEVRLTAKKKGLTFTADIPPGANLRADRNMLSFIVRNLLQNALKFTAQGGVTLRYRAEADADVLSVIDTGQGMGEETLQRLFQWQRRFTTRGTAGEKGSGVGLLIVRDFIEEMGGTLDVTSQPGEGTAISVRLPR